MTDPSKTFLILHGFQNRRPPEHWQHQLAQQLRDRGHGVRYPQLPEPDAPVLGDWLDALDEHGARPARGEFVVLAHSLSVLLWLRAGARRPAADRVLLVAPPSPPVTAGIPEIAAFADGLDLTEAGLDARLVYGDGDPYCPEGADLHYGRPLGLDMDHVPGGAHLNPGSGYGDWPSLLEWCEDPAVRIKGH
ncbi:putative alpha/beta hydrolase family esterase [Streptomyces sp. PvR006]|uniref:RBBP9/YdeN family alpha/beta hydrolase n=1 Tax=unclassified Streptomyces TaxID=2593676 RepID=UPI001AE126D4|nr:alpha/beta hydrolase [Streptomyces sp. PvR006]MBP2583561.1 putative alpha/beta hydrolase family esterase [Streptomyces sp. PvR006]